jgi:hypothetical protein
MPTQKAAVQVWRDPPSAIELARPQLIPVGGRPLSPYMRRGPALSFAISVGELNQF